MAATRTDDSAATKGTPVTRREETKIRLQASILEQLRDSSFRDLNIEDIAEGAGVSRSGFYFYYPDKTSLLIDSVGDIGGLVFEQADKWWSGEGQPGELIEAALSGIAQIWVDHGDLLRIAVEVATYDERFREFWKDLLEPFIEATAAHLSAEQETGAADPSLDPKGLAEVMIWGFERGLYTIVAIEGRDPREVVEPTRMLWERAIYGGRQAG